MNGLVAVIYIDKPEDETTVQELRVDDHGEFLDKWPGGFFEERGEELFG